MLFEGNQRQGRHKHARRERVDEEKKGKVKRINQQQWGEWEKKGLIGCK